MDAGGAKEVSARTPAEARRRGGQTQAAQLSLEARQREAAPVVVKLPNQDGCKRWPSAPQKLTGRQQRSSGPSGAISKV
jgi:hypothetical protein